MIITVFDTETTGLVMFPVEETNLDKLPYIIQLSFIQYDCDKHIILKTYNKYIKMKKEMIFDEKVITLTGITENVCSEKGIDIVNSLQELFIACSQSQMIISHNASFDVKMVKIEIMRNNVSDVLLNEFTQKMYCTMKNTIHLCNLMKPRKDNPMKTYKKFPTLCELHEKLFSEKPEILHNSIADVIVCLRCFLKIYIDYCMEKKVFETLMIECCK